MKCIICGKECRGPEGVIHPTDGYGYRHLACDPQDAVQKLDKSSRGWPDAMFKATDKGAELTPYGALITARSAEAVANAQKDSSKP